MAQFHQFLNPKEVRSKLKVAFFQKVRCIFKIAQKMGQKTILNKKFGNLRVRLCQIDGCNEKYESAVENVEQLLSNYHQKDFSKLMAHYLGFIWKSNVFLPKIWNICCQKIFSRATCEIWQIWGKIIKSRWYCWKLKKAWVKEKTFLQTLLTRFQVSVVLW